MPFNLQENSHANGGPQVIYFHMDILSFSCVGSARQTRSQSVDLNLCISETSECSVVFLEILTKEGFTYRLHIVFRITCLHFMFCSNTPTVLPIHPYLQIHFCNKHNSEVQFRSCF